MKKIYVFGHQNPDTDSVTSSIAISYLKNQLGYKATPMVLGDINSETEFVLNYFKFKKPKYLNDVRLQIKDIDYRKDFYINGKATISEAYNYMSDNHTTGIPIVDDKNKFLGLVTAKDLLSEMFKTEEFNVLRTSYNNILKILSAKEVLKFDYEFDLNIIAASYKSTTIIEEVELNEHNVLIVGNRHSVIENAIKKHVKLLIIVGNGEVKEQHILLAKANKVNIIKTPFDSYKTVRLINTTGYIKELLNNKRSYVIHETDYYHEFIKEAERLKYNNYPVVNKENICKGLLRLTENDKKNKKQVILVDHNEPEQSAIGIDEADVLEVIDHHKIGSMSTNSPINFRNMAVGSTNTILYYLFNESRIEIPCDIAGIMMAGILSDTLSLTSPTTTRSDIDVLNKLQEKCKIDYKEFALKMFEAASSIKGKTIRNIITGDMKVFTSGSNNFAVSQILTLNHNEILDKKEKYIEDMEKFIKENGLTFMIVCLTNAIDKNSYFLYTRLAKNNLEKAFGINDISQGELMKGIVSRKKQIVPALMEIME
ncbi:MAG: putative manganese-dependent inorganic diphosphatase [Bacilli bacterium]|nr:putative manganese-dependent inorganic diphosphatase [Bacilli bacterium]